MSAPLDDTILPRRDRTKGRVTHIIRPNARGSTPNYRVYVDTEANIEWTSGTQQRQTLWFGWACRERVRVDNKSHSITEEWKYFEQATEFFEWLDSNSEEKTATYIYAHNLQYDAALLSLATMANTYAWTVTEYVPANHLLWLTLRKGSRSLIFVDTLNYFPTSLATLGQNIGVRKQTAETHPQPVIWWLDYCRQDVEVIRQAMHAYYDLIRTEDLGQYRRTAASQAYGAWRHRFMHTPVLVLVDPRVERLERSAYHGGRSEVFYDRPLAHRVWKLDINSMYPSVMRTYLYPARKLLKGATARVDRMRGMLEEALVIARVVVQTDVPVYPYATPERVIYPTGRFETTLSTPELTFALDHGHVQTVREWATYEPADLFSSYVDTFYRLRLAYREQGNAAFSYLCKLLLNSLYGKFGQRGFQWKRCESTDDSPFMEWQGNCVTDEPPLSHRKRFGVSWHRETGAESFESFPGIAAHVTAHARMLLWRLITLAGRDNVYYCDTDSLFVNDVGKSRLKSMLDPVVLGKLKVEGVSDTAHFRAPKDYVFGDETHRKGVRHNARELSDTLFEQEQFESYDSVLARQVDGEITVSVIRKQLSRRNLQSKSTQRGWREPLVVEDDTEHSDRLPWEFKTGSHGEVDGSHATEGEEL